MPTTFHSQSCSDCGRPIVQSRPCACRPIGTLPAASHRPDRAAPMSALPADLVAKVPPALASVAEIRRS